MGRSRLARSCLLGKISRGLLVLALVGILAGCGRGTFVGRQYQDFTAYYNTFYNATKAFEEGRESVTQEDPEIDRNRYLSIFQEPRGASNAQPFDKAIEKSADVLREHPNSKWVDDAVLLIGKSYFYQENFVGAAQKFREGIALGTGRQEEARFWLARTLVVTDRYAEASDVLASALEGIEEVGPWTARMFLVRGELFVRQERWEEAEQALGRGVQGPLPDALAARSTFLLGQVRETLDRPTAARAAYRLAAEQTSSFELEFAAQMKAIELKGLHGDTAEALDELQALEQDNKYYEKQGEMAVVRARLYRAQGRPEEAETLLTKMLHQDESPTGETRGRLYYELATLHREAYEDFSQSAVYYERAATAMNRQTSGVEEGTEAARVVPWAPSDAGTQADRFQGLARQSDRVARLDSLLRLGRMSAEERQAVLAQVRQRQQEEVDRSEERRALSQSQFGTRGGQLDRRPSESNAAAETGGSEAGFLFHNDPARVQEGQRQFQQTWGDRPRVDNWRRQAAIRERSSSRVASSNPSSQEEEQAEEQAPPGADDGQVTLSDIPRDSVSQAQMETDRAVAQYELANSLFRAAGRPDSAATWYRRIVEENEDHPVARQALYALAEAHRAQGDTATARDTYRRVIEQYPESSFAERAREQLGQASSTSVVDRTEERADSAYAEAYEAWQEGDLRASLDKLLTVGTTYSDSEVAPKALFAAGVVYRRLVREDSVEAHRRLSAFLGRDSLQGEGTYSLGIDSSLNSASSSSDTTEGRPPRSVRPDSAQRDTSRIASEEEATAEQPASRRASTPLEALLSHLAERYPEAPHAERAQRLLRRMQGQQAEREPSLASAQGDSTDVDGRSEEEAFRQPSGVPDTVTSEAASNERVTQTEEESEEDQDPLPAPTSPSSSEEVGIPQNPLDPSAEGWTLLVQTYADRGEAMQRLRTIEQELDDQWPVDVLTDTEQSPPRFRLVAGHFETEQAATQGRERLTDRLSEELELWSLSSPDENPNQE